MPSLCRDCAEPLAGAPPGGHCPACGSVRLVAHPELDELDIAHIDCDAFYASVEKRDDPSLAGRPVIVGGGRRGVVAACCYVARMSGVRSAMPMFEARRRCPDAAVIAPDMEKYRVAGQHVRRLMRETTPLVEPLSIDEAFLDLSGTRALHHGSPARTIVRLIRRIEAEVGVTASVGLGHNKFLAKIASDLDKPRGFAVIGRAEALDFLGPRPVGLLWGVGAALCRRLQKDGIATIGRLRDFDKATLIARYGAIGARLYHFSRAEDGRAVEPEAAAKSVSAETTFAEDMADREAMERILWRLCEKVSRRLKAAGLGGASVTLKMKTADFRQFTRTRRLVHPTCLAEVMHEAAAVLLAAEADGRRFRLIGVGVGRLGDIAAADPPDLADPSGGRRAQVERAMDRVRQRFGDDAIGKGRGWRG